MNSGMFKSSVKTSTPAQALMQILCLTVFWLSALGFTAAAKAQNQTQTPAESMNTQVKQWTAQAHGIRVNEVAVAPLDERLKVQACSKPLNIDNPFASKETVRVRCTEPVWQLYLQVTLPSASTNPALNSGISVGTNTNPPRNMVVAKRLLQRGTVLQPDMLDEVQALATQVDTQLLVSIKDAQFAELTRDIPAGQAMRVSDIRRALMVKQGQIVMLSVGNKDEFFISTRMEALQDGRLGEQVKLKNPESGRQVSAIVTGFNAAKGL